MALGIYIHIPFCKSKCSYCDFYSIANISFLEDFLNALDTEIDIRKSGFIDKEVSTIYFGGGTPSVLNELQIAKILDKIYSNFKIIKYPEITFEANPNDLNVNYLKNLLKLKINRLSIGIQSIDKDILAIMGRKHSPEIAIKSILDSNDCGFNNISIDLIYGILGLSIKKWEEILNYILKLPVNHLSAYHLGIEKGTLLYRKVLENKFDFIDEDLSFEQYKMLIDISNVNSFSQYEISNFSKDGYISKHNSSYWDGTDYIGFGPSAHSLHNNIRISNVRSIKEYIVRIKSKELFYETDKLSLTDRHNEKIMLGLRTTEGLNLSEIENIFGIKIKDKIVKSMSNINPNFYEFNNSYLKLTPLGMFVSDTIIEYLFES